MNIKNLIMHAGLLSFQLLIVILEVLPQLTKSIYRGLQITETVTELVI